MKRAYDIEIAQAEVPVGTTVRLRGDKGWPRRDHILIGLVGTVAALREEDDGTVCARVRLDPNPHGRKWAKVSVSWLELATILDQLAAI